MGGKEGVGDVVGVWPAGWAAGRAGGRATRVESKEGAGRSKRIGLGQLPEEIDLLADGLGPLASILGEMR